MNTLSELEKSVLEKLNKFEDFFSLKLEENLGKQEGFNLLKSIGIDYLFWNIIQNTDQKDNILKTEYLKTISRLYDNIRNKLVKMGEDVTEYPKLNDLLKQKEK